MTLSAHVCTALFVNGRWVWHCQRHPESWGQPVFTTTVSDNSAPRQVVAS